MADIYDKKKRSWIMSRIRGKWTGLDKALHNQLKGHKVPHRMYPGLRGRPDVLVSAELVSFINGCFWHACPICKPKMPQGNREFWHKKIMDNKRRDKRIDRELIALGYSVMRLWGHEIKSNVSQVVKEIKIKIVRN